MRPFDRFVARTMHVVMVFAFWLTGYYAGWGVHEAVAPHAVDRVECQQRCGPAGCPAPVDPQPAARPPQVRLDLEPGVPTPYQTAVRIHYRIGDEVSIGSGTIVDGCATRSLVITCAHMFRNRGGAYPAPKDARGKVTVDTFDAGPDGFTRPTFAASHPGRVVDFDSGRDVGLVEFAPGRDLPASPLVFDDFKADRGARFYSVGCAHGGDPVASQHELLGAVVGSLSETGDGKQRTFDPSERGPYAAWTLSNPPVEGKSGGGLFTPRGRLAGICLSYTPNLRQGDYAQPVSMRFILARNGRDDLARPRPTNAATEDSPELSIVPGQAGHRGAQPTPQSPFREAPPVVSIPPPANPADGTPIGPHWIGAAYALAGVLAMKVVAAIVGRSALAKALAKAFANPEPDRSPLAPPRPSTSPEESLRAALAQILDHTERQTAELSRREKVDDLLVKLFPTSSPTSKAAPLA